MSPFAILEFKISFEEIEQYYKGLKEREVKETVNRFDEFAEPPIPRSQIFYVRDQLCFRTNVYHFLSFFMFIYFFNVLITGFLIINYTYIKPVLLRKRVQKQLSAEEEKPVGES